MKPTLKTLIATWVILALGHLSVHAKIELRTEDYPPFNMMIRLDEVGGYSTMVVKEMFKRAGVDYNLQVLPWKRAYEMTLQTKDYALFSTTRTPEREPLFKWVGPIANGNWVFLAKKEKNIKLNTIEDARKYRIGGYNGDAVALYLSNNLHFTLDMANAAVQNVYKLDSDHIDLWATGQLSGPYLARRQGIENFEQVLQFKEINLYLALNKNVSDEVITQLQGALDSMKKDGSYDAIFNTHL